MNSYSALGIVVFLLFESYAPTQGNKFTILDVVFENGERYKTDLSSGRFLNLIRSPLLTYTIEETTYSNNVHQILTRAATFGIEGYDTMLGRNIALRTNDNSCLRMDLISSQEAEQLFTLTTRAKLGESRYSYKVSVVYQYDKGRILNDVSISGFWYSTAENPQRRYIIHSGAALYTELTPHLLWTEEEFNYFVYDRKTIVLTLTQPVYKTYNYYLVKFVDASDLAEWIVTPGLYLSDDIPMVTTEILEYFRTAVRS